MPVRVAVDAMGGDHAPAVVVEGCIQAARTLGSDVQVLLTGPEEEISRLIREMGGEGLGLQVLHAPDIISMGESPTSAVKGKPNSSIHVGLQAQKTGTADAFVSAGNTGAVMAAALFILGRLPGVSRPAIIGYFPTLKDFCLIIDVGTNVDCRPEHLVQFALMGSIYAEKVLRRDRPVVALMNIGEEPGKGNEQAKSAFALLSEEKSLNFRGNIEGRDIMQHPADIVVCDGFVGNIMLKLGESIASVLPRMIGAEMARLQMVPAEQAIVGRAFEGVRRRFDYEEYGGVPLLGVGGNVIIGHGGSGARAIANMVRVAADLYRKDVSGSITSAMVAQPASA